MNGIRVVTGIPLEVCADIYNLVKVGATGLGCGDELDTRGCVPLGHGKNNGGSQ